MAHTLPQLPYNYDALEPYIDEQTMKIHHTKHHQAYIDKLNAALEIDEGLMDLDPEELIRDLNAVPEKIRTAVRNQGGGHVNHSFFWKILKKNVSLKGDIEKAIINSFGSVDKFKEEFSKAALGIFGSGWCWLVINKNRTLEIMTTPNQDSPLSQSKIPILSIDMWEHSWYIKHKSNKSAYVEDFFHVINWDQINKNLLNAKK